VWPGASLDVQRSWPSTCGFGSRLFGNVYGADEGANDVVKFSPSGNVLAKIGAEEISQPGGLPVDAHGALYVADEGGNAIEISSATGALMRKITVGFLKPRGVTVDTLGQLYVEGHDNDRIEKLDPSGSRLATSGHGVGSVTLQCPDRGCAGRPSRCLCHRSGRLRDPEDLTKRKAAGNMAGCRRLPPDRRCGAE